MFEKWPRLVAEYKPTFGSVFASYLKAYLGLLHLDMVIGNFLSSLSRRNWTRTMSFLIRLATRALYLRQWTMHRNMHYVNTMWKGCPHLGVGLQRALVEGCMGASDGGTRAPKLPEALSVCGGLLFAASGGPRGIRIRVTHKQFVGLTVPADQVIYSVSSSVWQCPRMCTSMSTSWRDTPPSVDAR